MCYLIYHNRGASEYSAFLGSMPTPWYPHDKPLFQYLEHLQVVAAHIIIDDYHCIVYDIINYSFIGITSAWCSFKALGLGRKRPLID